MEIINWAILLDYWLKPKKAPGGCIFEGSVVINHSFDPKTRRLYIGDKIKSTFCEASYDIKITFGDEVGMELQLINSPKNLNRWDDFHIYPNWTCCFCAPQEIKRIQFDRVVNAEKVLTENIIPFLYDQTYHAKTGKWIIWEYGHGDIGTIERYSKEEKHSQHFTVLTLNSLTPIWLQIFLAWGIHSWKKQSDYFTGLTLLRKHSKNILPLNIK